MFGEIGAWIYKALGGIKPDPEHPGFQNVILQPNFVKDLNSFSATHDGPYGKIVSAWKRQGAKVQLNIDVPPNSTATLYLTGKKVTDKKTGVALDSKETERTAHLNLLHYFLSGAHEFEIEQ
jgi:alpha-L-rhamnosidase